MRREGLRAGAPIEVHDVAGMVEGYLRSCRERRDLKPKTLQHRRDMLAPVEQVLGSGTMVADVDGAAVERLRRLCGERVADSTLRHYLWALRQALQWAQDQGWVSTIPLVEVPEMPAPRQEWLRSNEVEPFLEACTPAFRPLAEAAIGYGLREGEVCMAQACDFDLGGGALWVRPKPELEWAPKGGRARGIPLVGRGREYAEQLVAKLTPAAWAWPNLEGERRVPSAWWSERTRAAAKAAGIGRPLVFHDLRRTFGAMLIEAGAPMRAVQVALGHASITTTERVYAPISQRFVADAMGKMDEHLRAYAARFHELQPSAPAWQAPLRVIK